MAKFHRIFYGFGWGILLASPGLAQDSAPKLPNQARTVIFMHVKADKGVECGLLKPWARMAIKAQTLQNTSRWTREESQRVADVISTDVSDMACDNSQMVSWLEGSKKGFEREFLPPHLVVYQTMAEMNSPPKSFTAATQRLDYREALEKIDAHFDMLEASGAKGEGGKDWPDYREGIAEIVADSVAAMDGGTEPMSNKMKEVQTMMATSAVLVESWLADP